MLLVFGHHYGLHMRLGWMGVDLFFVLSGFLITGILYDSRDAVHRVRDFYMRRILRIFPLYYAVWLTLLVASIWIHWDWSARWLLWPLHLGNYARFIFFDPALPLHMDVLLNAGPRLKSFVPAALIGHFWTLCVEEQFYLLWPAVVFSIRDRKRLLQICLWSVPAVVLLRSVLWLTLPDWLRLNEFLLRFTLARVDSLMIGSALALLMRGDFRLWIERHWRQVCYPTYIVVGTAILFWTRSNGSLFGTPLPFLESIGLTMIDLCAAAIVVHAIQVESLLHRVLKWGPLAWLGSVSYGFYVFHDLLHLTIRHLVQHARHQTIATAAVALPFTIALSAASFYFFEQPFLKLKRYFPGQVHKAPV